ncbi:MAG: septum formation initiator family protein [Patescibacteria group bacterium]
MTPFIKKLLGLRVFLIINLVILFFLVFSFGREYMKNASIEREIANLQADKEALETQNVELLSLGQTIQTQFFLEKEGRLKYGLRKPGEQLVVVTDEQTNTPTATSSEQIAASDAAAEVLSVESASISNPTRWWYYFFKHDAYDALQQSYGG